MERITSGKPEANFELNFEVLRARVGALKLKPRHTYSALVLSHSGRKEQVRENSDITRHPPRDKGNWCRHLIGSLEYQLLKHTVCTDNNFVVCMGRATLLQLKKPRCLIPSRDKPKRPIPMSTSKIKKH
jgi:hypothetical protein